MLVTVTFDVHLWYGPFHESWLSKSQIGSSFVYKHPNFHKKSQQGESVVNIVTIAAKFL